MSRPVYVPRKYLGKLSGFKSKDERQFYNKMLRAYLKGHTHFDHKRGPDPKFGILPFMVQFTPPHIKGGLKKGGEK